MQHLKSRLDSGHLLSVQLADGRLEGTESDLDSSAAAFLRFMHGVCAAAQLVDQDSKSLHFVFSIPRQGTELASLFEAFEASRSELGIESYGISHATTLERVITALASRM